MAELPASSDYIIIGGGLAGCVLASRLSQYLPHCSITLLEAGPSPAGNPLVTHPLAVFAAHHSDIDWNYTTVSQRHLNNRTTYAAGGKILSGGTAINYGTWTRGARVDYDHWAEVVGDEGWGYEGMLKYFKRTERVIGSGKEKEDAHGYEGNIHVVSVKDSNENRVYPLREKVRSGWERMGVKYNEDGNGGDPEGIVEVVENWREGKRQLASVAYDLSSVNVVTGVLVKRVIVEKKEGKNIATGVELADGRKIVAMKEVIVSAGAYRTPQVLMLSGIGPSAELEKHGIPSVLEAPEVGKNFSDHMNCFTFWKLKQPELGLALGTPLWSDPAFQMGIPADWLISEHAPDEQVKSALQADGDVQDQHGLLKSGRCHTESIVAYGPGGFSFIGVNIPLDGTFMSATVIGTLPTSRGSITISSGDPAAAPIIDPNFYATESDRVAMRYGMRRIMQFFQDTPEGQAMVVEELPPDGFKKLSSDSTDEELDERIQRVGSTIFHPAGSAMMGKVVDTELKVMGIQGLRVVDSSIIPVGICAHYQVPVYATAEKAADLIAGR
ncbi:hypothetical protein EG329_005736 [Mollisiaceae sp. DMI_Dod_QoI]|nr:hypothetical protein EG329_005736 [Helotiales sp. DMI_Dod_QoI]